MRSMSRRTFFQSTALAGAGLGALLIHDRSATAFAIKPMDAKTQEEYANVCGSPEQRAYHQQLLAEAKAKLSATMTDAEIEAALAQLTCPICGCRLIG
ncbi:MAG TPA: hypothetical protein VLX09_22075 [Stellaceae bacterium]|nr:hypothetical protein [Stellaceae bacterium]